MTTWTTMHCAWQCNGARQRNSGISVCPRRNMFPFSGAASNFAASSGYGRKRGRHHDQGLCKKDFDLDAVPEASVMPHAAMCRHTGWRSLGSPEDVFSCSCTTAQLESRDDVCSRRVQKIFFCCLHQSFGKALLVR